VTFDEFEESINVRFEPYGFKRLVRPVALGQLGWKGPRGYAILSHHPKDVHFPAWLGFTDVGSEGVAITVMQAPTQPHKGSDDTVLGIEPNVAEHLHWQRYKPKRREHKIPKWEAPLVTGLSGVLAASRGRLLTRNPQSLFHSS
jgi:hypothetical protein